MNDEYYKQIDLGFDLTNYQDFFLNKWPLGSAKLTSDLIKDNIPEMKKLCDIMEQYDWVLWYPKVLSYAPQVREGEIHIDSSDKSQIPISLSFNIAIQNSTSMINRWFKFPDDAEIRDLYWIYERHLRGWDRRAARGEVSESMNAIMQLDMDEIIAKYQVCSASLSGCYFFRADIPHSADGRHNNDPRAILSSRWMNTRTGNLMDWETKQEMIDIVARHYLCHLSSNDKY